MLNTKVTAVDDGSLIHENGKIKAGTVIWTAGASNHPLFSKNSSVFNLNSNGRVEVNEFMAAQDNVYVIGDNANTKFSGMAQTALFDAKFLGKNFIRNAQEKSLRLYAPARPIFAIPIGRDYAVLEWGSIVLKGYAAWILRRIADLRLFISFQPYKKAVKTWRSGNRRARGFEVK